MDDIKSAIVRRLFHFKEPAGTSRGIYLTRESWYVVLTKPRHNAPPAIGVGECAPLPGLSCDALPDYEQVLRHACNDFLQTGVINREGLRPYPSILFGLETAWLSLQSSLRGGSFLQLFDTPFSNGHVGIPINGLVWMGSHEEMLRRMEEKLAAGFRCIKIKIGAIDFDSEIDLLARLRQRFGKESVELRADANGAFSPEDAPRKLERLARFGIHSIEQPIRAGQWEEMAKLCRNSPLPIALDEELIGVNDPLQKRDLLDAIRPQYLVLKPSLHGGISGAREWADEAARRHIPYWVTSALESNIGLNAIAQWTSSLPQPAERLHQGLGTGQLFTDNYECTSLHIDGECLWRGTPANLEFLREVKRFRQTWHDESPALPVHTSGSTGKPKLMEAEKRRMEASARLTCRVLGISLPDTVLLCLPLRYIAGKMQAIRAFVCGLRLFTTAPSSHPLALLHFSPSFAAMTPMQAYESLKVPREAALLRGIRCLLLGGGSISPELETRLAAFPNAVWSSYGMTETLSHIALRRLNGPDASSSYRPLPGVEVTLGESERLIINAPAVCAAPVVTNDRARLHPDGSFDIIGRLDNVVCSGGLKLQIEEIERQLRQLPAKYALTAVPDSRLGEALVLLYAGETPVEDIEQACARMLDRHARPRYVYQVSELPQTETGKPARAAIRALAEKLRARQAAGIQGNGA